VDRHVEKKTMRKKELSKLLLAINETDYCTEQELWQALK